MQGNPLTLLALTWAVVALMMTVLWLVQRRLYKNASIADVGWCGGFALASIWYGIVVHGDVERRLLVSGMAAIYAFRLGLYILLTRVMDRQEDKRYQVLRRQWGAQEQSKMFLYFQLQAAAVAVFSLPILVVMQNPRPPFSLWELAGVLLWCMAVTGEAAADWQLARFRAKPWNRTRVCREGLWRYSRHPNYFFEWLHWWAYVVMGIGLPNWGLTLIGPAAMGWALLKVTGIPLAEAQALRSRGEAYRDYQRTTSAFVPWFPKPH
ncbi:MAG: DUF1295 domain-containing protein [Nitrospiraceae bacterium]